MEVTKGCSLSMIVSTIKIEYRTWKANLNLAFARFLSMLWQITAVQYKIHTNHPGFEHTFHVHIHIVIKYKQKKLKLSKQNFF